MKTEKHSMFGTYQKQEKKILKYTEHNINVMQEYFCRS